MVVEAEAMELSESGREPWLAGFVRLLERRLRGAGSAAAGNHNRISTCEAPAPDMVWTPRREQLDTRLSSAYPGRTVPSPRLGRDVSMGARKRSAWQLGTAPACGG